MSKGGHKQSRDNFIRQEQIPAFELAKKAKSQAGTKYEFGKKKLKSDTKKSFRKKK